MSTHAHPRPRLALGRGPAHTWSARGLPPAGRGRPVAHTPPPAPCSPSRHSAGVGRVLGLPTRGPDPSLSTGRVHAGAKAGDGGGGGGTTVAPQPERADRLAGPGVQVGWPWLWAPTGTSPGDLAVAVSRGLWGGWRPAAPRLRAHDVPGTPGQPCPPEDSQAGAGFSGS